MTAVRRLQQIQLATLLLIAFLSVVLAQEQVQLIPLSWQTVDYEFYATLGIGTPVQPFRLVIDTGSANLWVLGSQCSSLECTQRAQYNPQQSSTSQVLGKQVPISYGAGQVNSILVQDVVSLPASGSSSSSSSGFRTGVTFTQTLGVAVQMNVGNSSSNTQQPWDGIMGMGRAKLAAGGVDPPVLSMYQQGAISQPRFGLYLLQDSSGPGSGGELAIGGYNKQRVEGDLTWVDVVIPKLAVQQGFWSVPVTSVGLSWPNGSSNTPANACTGFAGSFSSSSSSSGGQAGCIGLLDSGTAQIIGSIDQVAALNAALGGVASIQQVPFDCGKTVAAVLGETAQALMSGDPDTAANQVCSSMFGANAADSLGSVLCGAVQLELFLAQQQAPNSPGQAMAAAQDRSMALCEQLPYAFNVTLDCNKISSMPAIVFSIGGKPFGVPVTDYAYQNANNRQCYSKITVMGALGPGTWVLGSSFMHNMYTVFDYGVGQVAQQPAGVQDGASRGLKQASAGPRVGFGQLTAAEKSAAKAAYDKGLASKSSAAGSSGMTVLLALLMVFVAL